MAAPGSGRAAAAPLVVWRRVVTRSVVTAGVVALAAGCGGTPRIATGLLATAKTRLIALVNATGRSVGSHRDFVPVPSADGLPGHKKVLAFSVRDPGAHPAQGPG